MKHYLICSAPICKDDPNGSYKKDVVWYAGEEVCGKMPFQKFQKKQTDINRWVKKGKFKALDVPYNALQLETQSI